MSTLVKYVSLGSQPLICSCIKQVFLYDSVTVFVLRSIHVFKLTFGGSILTGVAHKLTALIEIHKLIKIIDRVKTVYNMNSFYKPFRTRVNSNII